MNNLLKILTLSFALMTPFTNASENSKTEVIGVLYYADWCGSCKALDPKVQQAKKQFDANNEPVLFITLDLTNENTKHQSKLLAGALGLDKLYAQNKGKTGYMVLIDADTKKVMSKLTKKLDTSEISNRIDKALLIAKS